MAKRAPVDRTRFEGVAPVPEGFSGIEKGAGSVLAMIAGPAMHSQEPQKHMRQDFSDLIKSSLTLALG